MNLLLIVVVWVVFTELLSTTGRRVNVDTLEGRVVAVDASIWMIQFLKAMRDERGDLMKNAHLLGLFRRLCKVNCGQHAEPWCNTV